ncbi:hypothetical protein NECAME_06893 [Necator americanus]|uniref:Mos1 transposase HTH domain-containing protein n=1 Tax=Necator americanus TaxID=51031 RepID=W2TTA0_NECAM|nr:hypothetical protein NECAME_06893 [Necator americanus]ETN84331.1 hypothetical protein NECAME_06893 [Necator americanus]
MHGNLHLRYLKANLKNARPQQHEVYFQHDNAQPHIARTTKFGCTTLPQSPRSPDLVPSDDHLFSYLQRHFNGQDFKTRDDIKKALEHYPKAALMDFELYIRLIIKKKKSYAYVVKMKYELVPCGKI